MTGSGGGNQPLSEEAVAAAAAVLSGLPPLVDCEDYDSAAWDILSAAAPLIEAAVRAKVSAEIRWGMCDPEDIEGCDECAVLEQAAARVACGEDR